MNSLRNSTLLIVIFAVTVAQSSTLKCWGLESEDFSKVKAIVASDIHYAERPGGRTESLPEPMQAAIGEYVKGVLAAETELAAIGVKPNECLLSTFKIAAPLPNTSLYIFLCSFGPGTERAVMYLYDSISHQRTDVPAVVATHWQTNIDDEHDSSDLRKMFRRPYMSFQDFDGTGRKSLVFERVSHNGNVLNAIDYEYYDVTDGLGLYRCFSRETRYQGSVRNAGFEFLRELSVVSPGLIQIDYSCRDLSKPTKTNDGGMWQVGVRKFQRVANEHRFKEVELSVQNERFAEFVKEQDPSWGRGVINSTSH